MNIENLVKGRFWALILVMLLTGFVLLVCLLPTYVSFYFLTTIAGTETLWKGWYVTFKAALTHDWAIGVTFPFLACCFVLGAGLQGFGVVLWMFIRRHNYFSRTPILRWVVPLFERLVKPESVRDALRETEGKYPLPGTAEYAELQFYLASEEGLGAYVEWERFLHFFYEYFAYASLIVAVHAFLFIVIRAAVMIRTQWRIPLLATIDRFGVLVLLVSIGVGTLFLSAAQLHRVSHRHALAEAWGNLSKKSAQESA